MITLQRRTVARRESVGQSPDRRSPVQDFTASCSRTPPIALRQEISESPVSRFAKQLPNRADDRPVVQAFTTGTVVQVFLLRLRCAKANLERK